MNAQPTPTGCYLWEVFRRDGPTAAPIGFVAARTYRQAHSFVGWWRNTPDRALDLDVRALRLAVDVGPARAGERAAVEVVTPGPILLSPRVLLNLGRLR